MGRHIDQADVEKIELLNGKGISQRDIAYIVGTSQNTVNRVLTGTHALQRPPKTNETEDGHDIVAMVTILQNVYNTMNDINSKLDKLAYELGVTLNG